MWPFKTKAVDPVPEKKFFVGSDSVYYSNFADWTQWDVEKAIQEGFKSSVPVFACIKKRYDAVSSIPLLVETMQGGEWVAVPDHPLKRLIDNPNPIMSTGELMRMMMTHLDLGGNAYWSKVRGGSGGLPQELWPIAPYPVTIKLRDDGLVNYYETGTRRKQFKAEDVCHFAFVNPENIYYLEHNTSPDNNSQALLSPMHKL